MDRAGSEIGDHFTTGTVEDRGGSDTDEGFVILLIEGFVDLELALNLNLSPVGGGRCRIFRRKLDGECDEPTQWILGKSRNILLGFQGKGAAGLLSGSGVALKSQKTVVEQGKR